LRRHGRGGNGFQRPSNSGPERGGVLYRGLSLIFALILGKFREKFIQKTPPGPGIAYFRNFFIDGGKIICYT
jgi:hypothetical protein